LIIAAATVVTIFCLISSKVLLSQVSYQRKVLHAKREAVKQLKADVSNAQQLVNNYDQVFEGSDPANIIGGKNTKAANAVPPDGDNGRIVLDALPTSYDFPALITSLNNILTRDGVASPSIAGSDDSVTLNAQPTNKPQPQLVKLTVSGATNYAGAQHFIEDFERSIRPFDITNLQLSGNDSQMLITMTVNTYFQPAKLFNIGTKVVQ
jgi:hypothetical protein